MKEPAPCIAVLLCCLLCALPLCAHEVRPAYLQLTELQPGAWNVLWKTPILDGRQLPLTPAFTPDCTLKESSPQATTGDATLRYFAAACHLEKTTLTIRGLPASLTDVMVRVARTDGSSQNHLLRPASPSVSLAAPQPSAGGYLQLGIEHLLFGLDHVLFVIGLVLLIPSRWDLFKTITTFTLAHSVTLALSILDLLTVPQAPVEAIIALSILFLARELLLPKPRRSILTTSRPWLMAMLFGLLHGLGFAGVLGEIGLPRDQLAHSLLLFNVGIEVGQLLVIAMMLTVTRLIQAITPSPRPTIVYAWIMGSVAGMWSIDRVWSMFI